MPLKLFLKLLLLIVGVALLGTACGGNSVDLAEPGQPTVAFVYTDG